MLFHWKNKELDIFFWVGGGGGWEGGGGEEEGGLEVSSFC